MPFDPFDLPLTITQWRSVKAPQGIQLDSTWGTYLRSKRFRAPETFATKNLIIGWSPVAFEGAKRRKDLAQRAYGIALDYEPTYDKIPTDPPPGYVVRIVRPGATLSEAAALWAPYYGLIHTTWSHERAEKKGLSAEPGPRFRVILPTRRPLLPEEYAYVWAWAAARASAAGHPIDEGTKDISRLWFAPGRAPGGPYEAIDLTGEPIDPDPICEAAREAEAREAEAAKAREAARVAEVAAARTRGAPVTGAMLGPAPAGTPSREKYVRAALNGAVRKLRDAPMGERNRELYRQAFGLGGFVATGELTAAEVEGALAPAVTVKGCNQDEIAKTIRRGIAAGREKPRPAPERMVTARAPVPAAPPVRETEIVYDEGEGPPESIPPDGSDEYDDPFIDVGPPTPRSPTALLDEAPVIVDVRQVARDLRKEDWRENGGPPKDDGPRDFREIVAEIEYKAEALAAGAGGDDGEPPSEPPGDDAPSSPRASKPFAPVQIEITTLEREVADQSIEALADSDEMVFTRAGELVHIIEQTSGIDESDTPMSERRIRLNERRKRAAMSLPAGAPIIRGITVPGVRSLLSKVCRFGRWKTNKKTDEEYYDEAHPPIWCVSDVHSRGNWPDIRPLTAIVECPMLRSDGSIIDKPGYDEFTGLFVRPAGAWPTVPDAPTREDARASIDLLISLVKDFPFEKPAHRSGWLAALLTPLCRHAYRGVSPMFVVDANVRGVGKSKLCDIISIIICGRPMPRQSESNDEAEEKKQITTILKSGVPMVLFDNLSKPLGSGHLDSLLTGEDWTDRVFGTQNAATFPNMCAWYATGNNVALKGDMARRVQHIRIQSNEENPEDRNDFASADIIGDTRARRVELLGAALTVIRAFCLARSRSDFQAPELPRWGSFEEWSAIVRGAIVWLGETDPAATRKDLETFADTQTSALSDFLTGWEVLVGDRPGITAAEAVADLESQAFDEKGRKTGGHATLLGAIGELMRTHNGLPSSSVLGYRLRAMRGRVVGGRYLWGDGAQGSVMRWRVRRGPVPSSLEMAASQGGTVSDS